MTPRQRVILAALLALRGAYFDGVILPSNVRQEIAGLLEPLRKQDRSLADAVRPIIQELLEEYDGPE